MVLKAIQEVPVSRLERFKKKRLFGILDSMQAAAEDATKSENQKYHKFRIYLAEHVEQPGNVKCLVEPFTGDKQKNNAVFDLENLLEDFNGIDLSAEKVFSHYTRNECIYCSETRKKTDYECDQLPEADQETDPIKGFFNEGFSP